MVLGDEDWQDYGTYWLHKYPQLSKPWSDERSFRLTTTSFSSIVNPDFYRGPEDVIKRYTLPPPKKSFQDQLASDCGLRGEPLGRDWYRKKHNLEVTEVGLAVPKWDHRLGSSIDGDVKGTAGIIEIKCPGKIYGPICKYLAARQSGWRPNEGHHEHIFNSHFDQMQGGMAITGKQWCDYVVYCQAYDEVFEDRVYFDDRYWHNTMYPKIKDFLETYEDLFDNLQRKYEASREGA